MEPWLVGILAEKLTKGGKSGIDKAAPPTKAIPCGIRAGLDAVIMASGLDTMQKALTSP